MAVAGITVVLDVFSGAHINAIGVAWGVAAALCAACYFVMSGTVTADDSGLDPITLAAGGLIVGSTAVALLGVFGILPLTFTSNNVEIAGLTTSWIVPIATLAIVSTAAAYVLGIRAVALLRPSFASLVGLAEVLSAVLWAWLLVGEAMTATQAIGGAVVLAGLALARLGDRRGPESAAVTSATLTDIGQNNATTR